MELEILTRRLALMEYIRCFQRKEMKYRLNVRQQNRLMARLWPFLKPDEYGAYTIGSLYLDTPDYLFIRRSLDKPIYKEKLRLRAYGVPRGEDMVFLELKKKWKGIVYKRRIALPLPQAEAYLQDGVPPAETGQIFREIDYVRRLYTPMPRVYVAYDRLAYTGREDPGVRLTFDTRIRWRKEELRLGAGSQGAPLLEPDAVLLEVKLPDAMPLWLAGSLSEEGIFPTSFSKVGACYPYLIDGRAPRRAETA